MAKIVEVTNPVTGQPVQVDQLDHTAQQIDDAVAIAPQLSNPNLLDNWYFWNPINQRGQTEYTAAGYTIDRWKLAAIGGVVRKTDGGIFFGSINQTYAYINHTLETSQINSLNGKVCTLSALTVDGNLYTASGVWGVDSLIANLGGKNLLYNNPGENGVNLRVDSTGVTLAAAKLELGSQQTLTHKDANGNWVLNEIPDYGEQLRRCQRYFCRINSSDKQYHSGSYTIVSPFMTNGSGNRAAFIVPSPMMRKLPTVSATGTVFVKYPGGGTSIDTSSVTLNTVSNNEGGTNINFDTTKFPANTYGTVVMDRCDIILNAEL